MTDPDLTILPDYSAWLTPERLAHEVSQWVTHEGGANLQRAAHLACSAIHRHQFRSVVEFGCGPGMIAIRLPNDISYVGVDANPDCLELAEEGLRPGFELVEMDVRDWDEEPVQLVICHAFLKHFGLHEWDAVADIIFRAGEWVVFSVPIAAENFDDGTEFHHTHVTRDHLTAALIRAGKVIVQSYPDDPDQPYGRCLFIAGPSR